METWETLQTHGEERKGQSWDRFRGGRKDGKKAENEKKKKRERNNIQQKKLKIKGKNNHGDEKKSGQ